MGSIMALDKFVERAKKITCSLTKFGNEMPNVGRALCLTAAAMGAVAPAGAAEMTMKADMPVINGVEISAQYLSDLVGMPVRVHSYKSVDDYLDVVRSVHEAQFHAEHPGEEMSAEKKEEIDGFVQVERENFDPQNPVLASYTQRITDKNEKVVGCDMILSAEKWTKSAKEDLASLADVSPDLFQNVQSTKDETFALTLLHEANHCFKEQHTGFKFFFHRNEAEARSDAHALKVGQELGIRPIALAERQGARLMGEVLGYSQVNYALSLNMQRLEEGKAPKADFDVKQYRSEQDKSFKDGYQASVSSGQVNRLIPEDRGLAQDWAGTKNMYQAAVHLTEGQGQEKFSKFPSRIQTTIQDFKAVVQHYNPSLAESVRTDLGLQQEKAPTKPTVSVQMHQKNSF